jgi:hypothetical protein
MLTVRAICPGAGNHGIQLGRRLLLLGKVYSLALEDVEKRLRTLQDLRGCDKGECSAWKQEIQVQWAFGAGAFGVGAFGMV